MTSTQEMFNSAAHHPIISLFSSTGSQPLAIFSSSISHDANGLSCICLLHDGRSEPRPAAPVILLPPSASLSTTGKIQAYHTSPKDLRKFRMTSGSMLRESTAVRLEASESGTPGSTSRFGTWGRTGLSKSASLMPPTVWEYSGCPRSRQNPGLNSDPESHPCSIYHWPFPGASSRPLTSWTTINLHLPTYLPHFSSSSLAASANEGNDERHHDRGNDSLPIPQGHYSHVLYVRVYATCRLRRIWFSDTGSGQALPWEFELFANDL
ncbi:hypothetical protein DFP72DRAFT_1163124 [Ephemerocybe angulata]|uniref:Uncharacterized protein n=1 Tax=Ephemerocybe angulata TaxID=980116 RepID=A0A8H6IGR8_9AGAR|nr:hypothetical protein DFP72DRAFT_1163124 [Tulosesus angulatus]